MIISKEYKFILELSIIKYQVFHTFSSLLFYCPHIPHIKIKFFDLICYLPATNETILIEGIRGAEDI